MQLAEPLIPVPSNTPNENFFRGFALMAQVNNQRKELEMAGQKMVQDETLRSRAMDIQEDGQALEFVTNNKRLDAAKEENLFRFGRTTNQLQSQAALIRSVRTIKDPIGSQGWKTEALNQLLNHPEAQQTPAYESIYEQVKPRSTNTGLGQKAYNGMISHLGMDKDLINRALENPQNFTKTDLSAPGKIGILVGDIDEEIPVLDEEGKPQLQDGAALTKSGVRPVYRNINKSSWEALRKYRDTYGDDGSTGKELDLETAKRITAEIKHAHPDWDKERIKNESIITARRNGYDVP